MKPILSALLLPLLFAPAVATAADGEPIAIRFWEDRSVSIESHSGLNLEIRPSSSLADAKPPSHRVDQTVDSTVELDHVLSRSWNAQTAVFQKREENVPTNAIQVRSEHPRDSQLAHALRINLDGVSMAVPVSLGAESEASQWDVEPVDVLLIPQTQTLRNPVLLSYIKALKPKQIVVSAEVSPENLKAIRNTTGFTDEPFRVEHNTAALSKAGLSSDSAQRLVTLSNEPHKLSATLETLFEAMEKSNRKSQQVFEKLSAEQLNFRPSNGTHTPRWNSEHMMGRQLVFFSQIFHAMDPAVPVMNLNPKQMPKDYVAAHPDWDGAEEARQMQRVSEFTRRFAYLLEGIDLNKRAPGSGWTLGALLRQMERHYDDHTANTVKKFSLPDWPSE
ncbi:MAG: DinB family protein [Planctomycetota bacterium]